MITTRVPLGDEASKGCSRRETTENTADDSEDSPRSSKLVPTSQIERLAEDSKTAEKRRGMAVYPNLSTISPLKKQRIQAIVRIRPIEDNAGRYTEMNGGRSTEMRLKPFVFCLFFFYSFDEPPTRTAANHSCGYVL